MSVREKKREKESEKKREREKERKRACVFSPPFMYIGPLIGTIAICEI